MTNQIQRTARAGPKEPVTADILVREPQDVVTFEREEREGKDSLVRGRESMDLVHSRKGGSRPRVHEPLLQGVSLNQGY